MFLFATEYDSLFKQICFCYSCVWCSNINIGLLSITGSPNSAFPNGDNINDNYNNPNPSPISLHINNTANRPLPQNASKIAVKQESGKDDINTGIAAGALSSITSITPVPSQAPAQSQVQAQAEQVAAPSIEQKTGLSTGLSSSTSQIAMTNLNGNAISITTLKDPNFAGATDLVPAERDSNTFTLGTVITPNR